MKRSLLLLALAVFALGFAAVPQSGENTTATEERHRVVCAIDPITGEYLFAEKVDSALLSTSKTSPPESSASSGNSIQMNRIAVLPPPIISSLPLVVLISIMTDNGNLSSEEA